MSDYDSILKEKKRKKDDVKEENIKEFPTFSLSFICIIIFIIVSYVIYFNLVLSPKNIVISDCQNVLSKYGSLIKNVPLKEFYEEKKIVGTVNFEQEEHKFSFIKNNGDVEFNISNDDRFVDYFVVDDKSYVKVPSIEEYVLLDNVFSVSSFLEFESKLNNIDESKYLKSIYLKDERPVVEINFSLNTSDLNRIFGVELSDEYEVLATFKNNAITNKIIEIKIVLNNNTNSIRKVITINDEFILYNSGEDVYKIILQENKDNFIIKISKNDQLYSVFSGVENEENYHYVYQIIDTIYNINIYAYKNENGYLYEIVKKNNEIEKKMSINLNIDNTYLIEGDINNFIDDDNKIISDNYNNDINYFKDKYLEFIK